jgi:hypothetical protein
MVAPEERRERSTMNVMRVMRQRDHTIGCGGCFVTAQCGNSLNRLITQHAVLSHRKAMARWQWQNKAIAVKRIHGINRYSTL